MLCVLTAPDFNRPDIVPIVYPIPLAPLLVEKLLELLMCHNLLMAVQNGHLGEIVRSYKAARRLR